MPSRASQMAAIRAWSADSMGRPPAVARLRNSWTASPGPSASAATESPGTGNTHSNGTSSRARLVARTTSRGLPTSRRSSRTTTPSSRCSQLSRTSSACRSASQPRMWSVADRPGAHRGRGRRRSPARSWPGPSPGPGRRTRPRRRSGRPRRRRR